MKKEVIIEEFNEFFLRVGGDIEKSKKKYNKYLDQFRCNDGQILLRNTNNYNTESNTVDKICVMCETSEDRVKTVCHGCKVSISNTFKRFKQHGNFCNDCLRDVDKRLALLKKEKKVSDTKMYADYLEEDKKKKHVKLQKV